MARRHPPKISRIYRAVKPFGFPKKKGFFCVEVVRFLNKSTSIEEISTHAVEVRAAAAALAAETGGAWVRPGSVIEARGHGTIAVLVDIYVPNTFKDNPKVRHTLKIEGEV